MERINERKGTSVPKKGLSSGFGPMDKLTTGWHKGNLILIAGRPAMGKTLFALNLIKNVAIRDRKPVGFFSVGTTRRQFTDRMLSVMYGVPSEEIYNDSRQLVHRMRDLQDAPIYIDDSPSLALSTFYDRALKWVRQRGVRLIIVDDLRLIEYDGMPRGNCQEEMEMVSRSLKRMAMELNVPIIALSQLARRTGNGEEEKLNRPQMDDLRKSGNMDRPADVVCFIHRPGYYKAFSSADGKDSRDVTQIIVAKNKNGATGQIALQLAT
ncbi:MAG: DnaB-like helicase C-terminal domain-containing protein [Mediterranea sp.]|jgi:replicative DNA helicase|nr:DnaB-like helicase C-terminal domain-containing protein [Mediterranea sp.]